MEAIVLIHATTTMLMTGLIWFVQIVHYPLFTRVGADCFANYEAEHTRRTTWVVAPIMVVEAATAVVLVTLAPAGASRGYAWTGIALLILVWLSTALVQIPCHARLAAGVDSVVVRRLVRTNWVRTIAWTGRTIIAVMLVAAPLVW